MPFCEIILDGKPVMSSPSNRIRPLVGRSTPVRQLKKVLLPAPFGPMMARTSSRLISKLIWESAASPPNRTVNSSVLRIGAEAAPRLLTGSARRLQVPRSLRFSHAHDLVRKPVPTFRDHALGRSEVAGRR